MMVKGILVQYKMQQSARAGVITIVLAFLTLIVFTETTGQTLQTPSDPRSSKASNSPTHTFTSSSDSPVTQTSAHEFQNQINTTRHYTTSANSSTVTPFPTTTSGVFLSRDLQNSVVNPVAHLPPSEDGMQWALSGDGAVMVVDLGDGSRWLQALHKRAQVPLLQWQAPTLPWRGTGTLWLGERVGYVFAVSSFRRLEDFSKMLTTQTKGIMVIPSTAPIVLSVLESISNKTQSRSTKVSTFNRFIAYYISNNVLLLEQIETNDTTGMFADFVKRKILTSKCTPVGTCFALISNLRKRNSRPMGGRPVTIFQMINSRGGYSYSDPTHQLLQTLEQKLDCRFLMTRDIHDGVSLAESTVDLCPIHIVRSDRNRIPFDIIEATTEVERMLIIVPKASCLYSWPLWMRVFNLTIWMMIVGTAVVYALVWRFVAGGSWVECVAATLRGFSSCGGTPQYRVSATPQRLQLGGVLLASVVLVGALIKGRLIEMTRNPVREKEIDTLEQLSKSGIPVWYFRSNAERSMLNFPEAREEISRRINLIPSTIVDIDVLIRRTDFDQSFAFSMSERVWEDSAKAVFERMRAMNEKIDITYSFWHVRSNWPWKSLLNLQIMRISEIGLIQHWKKTHQRYLAMYSYSGYGYYYDGCGIYVIELHGTLPYFYVLATGLVCATLCFVVEQCYARRSSRCCHSKRNTALPTVPVPITVPTFVYHQRL